MGEEGEAAGPTGGRGALRGEERDGVVNQNRWRRGNERQKGKEGRERAGEGDSSE